MVLFIVYGGNVTPFPLGRYFPPGELESVEWCALQSSQNSLEGVVVVEAMTFAGYLCGQQNY